MHLSHRRYLCLAKRVERSLFCSFVLSNRCRWKLAVRARPREPGFQTPQLKNVFDFKERVAALEGAFTVEKAKIQGKRVLLFDVIRDQLDDLIQKNCKIFIGDADRAVQQHFADRGHGNVIVYCLDHCRNNVGNWQVRPVPHQGGRRDFSYFAQKDLAMARDARCGVMFWDGKSKGTLNNIHNLLREQKAVLVYLSPEKAFHKLTKESDLNDLLSRCDREQVDREQRQLQQSEATLHRRQMSLP